MEDIVIAEPAYLQKGLTVEDESLSRLAENLQLDKHPNGGYFKETDRPGALFPARQLDLATGAYSDVQRNASSLIHFLMTCESPLGKFHTNVTSRTIHVLQRGSGVYVLIHPNGGIETFKVGFKPGEKTQWVVEPGVYKGCYLVSADGCDSAKDCLWVSEVVVPGFDFDDMKFLTKEKLVEKVGSAEADALEFLI